MTNGGQAPALLLFFITSVLITMRGFNAAADRLSVTGFLNVSAKGL